MNRVPILPFWISEGKRGDVEGNEFTLEIEVTVPRGPHMGLATVAPGIQSKGTPLHRRVIIHMDNGAHS
jgi:hypothetical protein